MAKQAQFSVQAEVAETMREIVAPLRTQLDDINARIDSKETELKDLRGARTQLLSVLNRLDPTTKPAKTNNVRNGNVTLQELALQKKTATLRKLINDKPELFANGTTINGLAAYWQKKQLQPPVSPAALRTCFELVRDEGILRADKVVKGGGMSWKLVNGSAPDA